MSPRALSAPPADIKPSAEQRHRLTAGDGVASAGAPEPQREPPAIKA
jgi:hypothetical protein